MREFDEKSITQAVIDRSIRPTFYPVPTDGPVGRPPSVSPGPHPHDRLSTRPLAGDHAPVRCREPISGFRCGVRHEGIAGCAIRPAPAGCRSERRALGHAVLYGGLRLPAAAGGRLRMFLDSI